MTRGSMTQTRTFTYDTEGRLTSMTQTKTVTSTFTYNTDHTVATKVDVKNQLDPVTGMIVLDVVDGRIVCVEILYRDELRSRILRLLP